MFLNILLFLGTLVGIYSTAIIICQYEKKVDLHTAKEGVNKFISSNIRKLIGSNKPEIPYRADIILVNRLIEELSKYSLLTPENTKYTYDYYADNLPCIQLHLITQTESNHHVITSVMDAEFSRYMAEIGRNNYCVKTIVKKYKTSEYIVIILYATLQAEWVALNNLINSVRNHAVNAVRSKASPSIDSELEQDLKNMGSEGEDENV